VALDKRDIGWQSSLRVLLSYGNQLNMIYFLQQVFDLIVIIRFISINNRTIRKLIGIILQGINIAKASMGQETFNGLSVLGHHEMNFQSIKIPFLTQYLCQLRKAERGLRGMNTAQAGDLVENLGQ